MLVYRNNVKIEKNSKIFLDNTLKNSFLEKDVGAPGDNTEQMPAPLQ